MNPRALSVLVVVVVGSLIAGGVASGQGGPSGPRRPTAHLSRICTYRGHKLGNGRFFVSASRRGESYGVDMGANKVMKVTVTLRVAKIHFLESQTVIVGYTPCLYGYGAGFIATNALARNGKQKYLPKGAVITITYKGKIVWRRVYPWNP